MPLLIAGEDESRARSRAEELLAAVGLAGRMTHRPVRALGRRAAAGRGGARAGRRSGSWCWRTSRRATWTTRNSERLHELFAQLSPGVRDRAGGGDAQSLAGRPGRPGAVAGGRTSGAAVRRGVDALMSCDQCHEREAVIHLTQIVNEQVTTLHLCEQCAAEKGVESPGRGAKTPLGNFLAAMGQERRSRRRRAADRRDLRPLRRHRSRTSGRPAGWGAPTATAPSRRRCGTCCAGSTARPTTWASATREREAPRRRRARAGRRAAGAAAARGRDRELRAGRRAARPAPGGGMIDLSLLTDGGVGWLDASGPVEPPGALDPDPAGPEPRRPRVPGPHSRDRAGGDPRHGRAAPPGTPCCCAGRPGSGWTGWTGPTGSCCTSGTW